MKKILGFALASCFLASCGVSSEEQTAEVDFLNNTVNAVSPFSRKAKAYVRLDGDKIQTALLDGATSSYKLAIAFQSHYGILLTLKEEVSATIGGEEKNLSTIYLKKNDYTTVYSQEKSLELQRVKGKWQLKLPVVSERKLVEEFNFYRASAFAPPYEPGEFRAGLWAGVEVLGAASGYAAGTYGPGIAESVGKKIESHRQDREALKEARAFRSDVNTMLNQFKEDAFIGANGSLIALYDQELREIDYLLNQKN